MKLGNSGLSLPCANTGMNRTNADRLNKQANLEDGGCIWDSLIKQRPAKSKLRHAKDVETARPTFGGAFAK